jgi:RecA-family ATPase
MSIKMNQEENVYNIHSEDLNYIKTIKHEDLKKMKSEKTKFILHPFLPEQGLAIIYSATGVGKTLFTLNCAYAIAAGGDFLKYSAPQPKKVLYIDGEMSLNQMVYRYQRIIEEQGDLEFPDYFELLNNDQMKPNCLPLICSSAGQQYYIDYIDRNNIDVIVFDNVSTLSDIDENKSDEWRIIQKFLLKIRSMGKSVILVHHTGKNKNEYRGSSRMMDTADTSILLTNIKDDELEGENQEGVKFKIRYKKDRVIQGKDAIPFNVYYDSKKWSIQSSQSSNLNYVIEALKNHMSHQAIANEMGVSRPYVTKLASLAKKNNLYP